MTAGRVAIIGAGHVGATTAYALMLRGLFAEIILIDSDVALATAEAAAISDASALARPARIVAGTYADAAIAQIAIVTAGAATTGAQSRLSVADGSARIVTSCVTRLIAAGFDGIIIVAANPVDLMALVALRCSGLAPARVIGTGTLLDSCRLRQDIATGFGVAPASVDGWVLGEHGDGEVAIRSSVRVGGLPLDQFQPAPTAFDFDQVAVAVREQRHQRPERAADQCRENTTNRHRCRRRARRLCPEQHERAHGRLQSRAAERAGHHAVREQRQHREPEAPAKHMVRADQPPRLVLC